MAKAIPVSVRERVAATVLLLPRVRFNKDGKKINPQQAAKTAQA